MKTRRQKNYVETNILQKQKNIQNTLLYNVLPVVTGSLEIISSSVK